MADKLYDVERVASQVGNILQYLKQPGGSDPTGITQTGDVISQVGNDQGPPQPKTATSGTTTPMSGSLSGGSYDGYGISQEFGAGGHPGLDIATPVGTKLIAPIEGTVTHAANDDPGGYGQWVEITASDGTVVRYGHMSSLNVQPGQQVGPGTLLGLSGGAQGAAGSGNASGPHLHFEVHQTAGGPAIDPSSYLAGGWQIFGAN